MSTYVDFHIFSFDSKKKEKKLNKQKETGHVIFNQTHILLYFYLRCVLVFYSLFKIVFICPGIVNLVVAKSLLNRLKKQFQVSVCSVLY